MYSRQIVMVGGGGSVYTSIFCQKKKSFLFKMVPYLLQIAKKVERVWNLIIYRGKNIQAIYKIFCQFENAFFLVGFLCLLGGFYVNLLGC